MVYIKKIILKDTIYNKNDDVAEFLFVNNEKTHQTIITGPVGCGKTLLMHIIKNAISIFNEQQFMYDDILKTGCSYISIVFKLNDNEIQFLMSLRSMVCCGRKKFIENKYDFVDNEIIFTIKKNTLTCIEICCPQKIVMMWRGNYVTNTQECDKYLCTYTDELDFKIINLVMYKYTSADECRRQLPDVFKLLKINEKLIKTDVLNIGDIQPSDFKLILEKIKRHPIYEHINRIIDNEDIYGEIYNIRGENILHETTRYTLKKLCEKIMFCDVSYWDKDIVSVSSDFKYLSQSLQTEFKKICKSDIELEYEINTPHTKYTIKPTINTHPLSSGQTQIFRMLYELLNKKNDIIFFDEPLTHVNGGDVRKICEYMKEKYSNKQIIIITHQDSFANFDTIDNLLCIRNFSNMKVDTKKYAKTLLDHPELLFDDNIVYCEGYYDLRMIKMLLVKYNYTSFDVIQIHGDEPKELTEFLKLYKKYINYIRIRDCDKIDGYKEFNTKIYKYVENLIDFNDAFDSNGDINKKKKFAVAYFYDHVRDVLDYCYEQQITTIKIDDIMHMSAKCNKLLKELSKAEKKYVRSQFTNELYQSRSMYDNIFESLQRAYMMLDKRFIEYIKDDGKIIRIKINPIYDTILESVNVTSYSIMIELINDMLKLIWDVDCKNNESNNTKVFYWYPDIYEIEGINYVLFGKWSHNVFGINIFDKICGDTPELDRTISMKQFRKVFDKLNNEK